MTSIHNGLASLHLESQQHSIICITDRSGLIIHANEGYCRISGYNPEELQGQDRHFNRASSPTPSTLQTFRSDLEAGKIWHGTLLNRNKGGSLYWVACTILPVFDSNGVIVQHLELAHEMTSYIGQQNQTELSLAEKAEEFRTVLESLPQLFWTCRVDGPCDYLSKQWLEYTGVPEAEQLGYGWLDQLHPDDKQATIERWTAVAPLGKVFDIKFRIRHHTGEYRWFQTRATPLTDKHGKVLKWFGSNTDVQDLLNAQEELAQVNQQLELRVQERTNSLAIMAERLQAMTHMLGVAQRIAHLGSWQFNVASGEVQWSEEIYRTFHIPPANVPPGIKEQEALFTRESWQRLQAALTRCIENDQAYELELQLIRPSGELRWAVAQGERSVAADGSVNIIGTFQDITELKQVQLSLAKLNERMTLATAGARVAIWDWYVGEDRLVWDDQMYELYGVSRSDFKGYDTWAERIHPDDFAETAAQLTATLNGVAEFDTNFRIVKPGGEICYLQARAHVFRAPDGRPLRMIGANWDITRQRVAENELLAKEKLLSEFVLHAPAAIAMFDTNICYLHASKKWIADYHLDAHNLIGRSHYDVFPKIPQEWKDIHQRVLETGVAEERAEDSFIGADGNTEYLQWEVRPWYKAPELVGGLIFFTQVITERKRTQIKLEQQATELKRSNQDLEQFAYIASHDLQEPLRAISVCSQLLQNRYATQLDGTALELMTHMVEGADRMKTLIQDLLAYSRAGTHMEARSMLDSNAIMQRVIQSLAALINEKNAHISLGYLPDICANPLELSQVLQNLIGNSLKYSAREQPRIHIEAKRLDHFWEFSVRDNGIGIDPQYHKRIFDIFQRLHGRQEYPGTGIGLALCKKIIERHGGSIRVESRQGEGATFYFTLPD